MLEIVGLALEALVILIIADAAISTAMAYGARISLRHPAIRFVRSVTKPLLDPVRRFLPPPHRTGGWDFSPLIVILALQMLRQVLMGH